MKRFVFAVTLAAWGWSAPASADGAAPGIPSPTMSVDDLEAALARRNASRGDAMATEARASRAGMEAEASQARADAQTRAVADRADARSFADNEADADRAARRRTGYWIGGAGLAVVGVGVLSFLVAQGAKSSITSGGLASSSDISSAASSVNTEQVLAYTLWSVGGSAVLAGGALVLFSPSVKRTSAPTTGLRFDRGALRW